MSIRNVDGSGTALSPPAAWRYGGLMLNVHFHTVAMDGVFSVAGPSPVFHQLRGPTDDEVADIVAALAQDVVVALRALGYPPHPPARGPPRRAELDLDMDQREAHLDDDT
jgi:hypothetical protein